ncbi:MAG: ABC transporter permease [Actinomycetota bacterium]
MTDDLIRWDWLADNVDVIGEQLLQHLSLTLLAVGIGLLISFPLAVYAHRHRRWYPPITWVTGILYTIPSLALFAFLVPFFGLSTLTAEIGLVSYTLLILIRNTVAGLGGVPEDVKEAARGVGYTGRELLWRVEVPLALPVIVAGIRIATVTTIGLVTVTALIGKGGVGFFFLAGFRRLYPTTTAILLGLVLSVALALAAEGLLLSGQRILMPWARARKVRSAT